MPPSAALELKVFVPARDYARSLAFYCGLGFDCERLGEGLASVRLGDHCAFLLQDFHDPGLAQNLMLHLTVADADAWWRQFGESGLAERLGGRCGVPGDRPWGMRDFTLHDPSGVLWRIGHAV
ncbi:glyoxalase [Xanthomonas sp. Kuri4-1]